MNKTLIIVGGVVILGAGVAFVLNANKSPEAPSQIVEKTYDNWDDEAADLHAEQLEKEKKA